MLGPPWLTRKLQEYLTCRKAFALVWCRTSLIRSCCLRTVVVRHTRLPVDLLYAHGLSLQQLHLAVPLECELDLSKLPRLQRLQLGPLPTPGWAPCCQHPSLRQARLYLQHMTSGCPLTKLPRQLTSLCLAGSWQALSPEARLDIWRQLQLDEQFPSLQELEMDGRMFGQAHVGWRLPPGLRELRLHMEPDEFRVCQAAPLAALVARIVPSSTVVRVNLGSGFDQLTRLSAQQPTRQVACVRQWIEAVQQTVSPDDLPQLVI